MANNVVEILKGVVGELKDVANSETIIGDPVTAGDKTIIPVVKISFGFGAGGGEEGNPEKNDRYGGGGGGGARIEPAAFIIVSAEDVKLLPVGKGKWDSLVEAVPDIAKKVSKVADKVREATSKKDKDGGHGEGKGKGHGHGGDHED
jgi:uncharacterized spore protein YtfJ